MENSKKESVWFWGAGAALVVAFVGSAYYFYEYFSQEDIPAEDRGEIEDLKQKLEEEDGKITVDTAIKIMTKAQRMIEDKYKKDKPDLDSRRRAAFNNEEEYHMLCQEMLEYKHENSQSTMDHLLKMFGTDMEELTQVMQNVNPTEIEKKALFYDIPIFEEGEKLSKSKLRQAFKFFAGKIMAEAKNFRETYSQMQNSQPSEIEQQQIMVRVMIMKVRVDDELYLKYNCTEAQMRFLLHEYELLDDPEIKEINDKLMKYEEMMGGR